MEKEICNGDLLMMHGNYSLGYTSKWAGLREIFNKRLKDIDSNVLAVKLQALNLL